MPEHPFTVPETARSVLLTAPGGTMASTTACLRAAAATGVEQPSVLYFTFGRRPEAVLERWYEEVGGEVASFVVIDAREAGGDDPDLDGATVVSEHPDDLTWVGVRATEHLSEWYDADERVVVCFDSLSTLLQYVSAETLYRFLHVLTGRVESGPGVGFYHIDPTIHEESVVNTVAQLCDTRIDYDADEDSWSVRTL